MWTWRRPSSPSPPACGRKASTCPTPNWTPRARCAWCRFSARPAWPPPGPATARSMREAATTCRGHLEGVALRFASIDRTEMEDRTLEYAACMREHGFDMPDPDFSGGAGPGPRGPVPRHRPGGVPGPRLPGGQRGVPGHLRRPDPRERLSAGRGLSAVRGTRRNRAGRAGVGPGASLPTVGAGGRVVAVVAVVLAIVAGDRARPRPPAPGPESRLERVTAALEREADRLQRLGAGPRVGGADWAMVVQAHLTVVEVRVWRWQVAAAKALGSRLGATVAAEVQASAGPSWPLPALDLAANDAAEVARLRPVLADWEAYRQARSRVLGLVEALRGCGRRRRGGAAGPGPGVPGRRPSSLRAHLGGGATLGAHPQGRGRPRRAGHAPGRHRERDDRASRAGTGPGASGCTWRATTAATSTTTPT